MEDTLGIAVARRLAASGAGRSIRLRSALSLREVARRVGVEVSTVWRWENGQRAPRGPRAARWADLLNDLDEVL
jgi:transcriptional regulator with XRE-family HTH domain